MTTETNTFGIDAKEKWLDSAIVFGANHLQIIVVVSLCYVVWFKINRKKKKKEQSASSWSLEAGHGQASCFPCFYNLLKANLTTSCVNLFSIQRWKFCPAIKWISILLFFLNLGPYFWHSLMFCFVNLYLIPCRTTNLHFY